MARILNHHKRGLSLLESAVALSLIGFIVILMLNLYPSALLTLKTGEDRFQAQNLAASLISDHMAIPYSDLTPGTQTLGAETVGGTIFQRQVVVEALQPDRLKSVTVTISWERGPNTRRVSRVIHVANVPR